MGLTINLQALCERELRTQLIPTADVSAVRQTFKNGAGQSIRSACYSVHSPATSSGRS
jgi:hypothetical protein